MKNIKKRYWAVIVYPESCPSNWQDILQERGLQVCISPLHDKDLNPDNTPKKAHWHCILCWENPTTFNNVKELCDELNCPIPQPLDSVRGYYRYLTHKDNPEKYQYDDSLITTINGFDISNFSELTNTEVIAILKSIINIIRDNNIFEFSQLVDLLTDNEETFGRNFLDVLSNKYFYINTYLTSYRHSRLTK